MKKSILQMKDVIVLDKSSQKKIYGGKGCTILIQNEDGSWKSEQGQCAVNMNDSNPLMDYFNHIFLTGTSYCQTDSNPHGEMKLTSNGGKSRC
jgi:hypothetical protein